MDFVTEDIKSLMSQFKDQENQLKIKRRWLAGLPISLSDEKKVIASDSINNRFLPESILREDDVSYERIKKFVEKGVGGCDEGRTSLYGENMEPFSFSKSIEDFHSLLDGMTNKGLCTVADILTCGSIKFEKTRWKMKKIIKEYLPKKQKSLNLDMYEKLSPVFKDSHNFHWNHETLLTPTSRSYQATVMKVLDGLDDLPTRALTAMQRKLRGTKGFIPQLKPPRCGWGRSVLIRGLRRSCMDILSKIGEEEELHERLTQAMSVAGLTLKHILGYPYVTEFRKFSPETEVLHNEIAKALWLLEKKVRFVELSNLQLVIDPDAKLTNRSLRTAIKNLLIDYLYECSDMDTVPDWLPEILSIINRCSRSAPFRYLSKKAIEKEVECILNVSAQTKQIVCDLSPEHEFDHDFADSYMEDLEESDDGNAYDCDKDDAYELQLKLSEYNGDSCDHAESIGEINFNNSTPLPYRTKGDCDSPVLTTSKKLKAELESIEPKVFDTPRSLNGNQHYFGSTRNLGLTGSGSVKMTENKLANSPAVSLSGNIMNQEPAIDPEHSPNFLSSAFSSRGTNSVNDNKQDKKDRRSLYLSIQEASDEASLVAYRLIGRMLDEFAQIEGLELDVDELAYLKSTELHQEKFKAAREHSSNDKNECGHLLIQLVQEFVPSFSQSGKERLEKLMGSR